LCGEHSSAIDQQMIPIQFLRRQLCLLACLPILIAWRKSRRSLLLSLGWALFVLVALHGVLAENT
jgi:hypothetical protein